MVPTASHRSATQEAERLSNPPALPDGTERGLRSRATPRGRAAPAGTRTEQAHAEQRAPTPIRRRDVGRPGASEHDAFADHLRERGVTVHYFADLLAEAIEVDEGRSS